MTNVLQKIKKAVTDPKLVLARLRQKYLDKYNADPSNFVKYGESDLLEKVSKINPKVVFDVGANVGDWSLLAHKICPQATIHCFELSERTFNTLRSHIHSGPFVLNNIGLSDKSGVFEYKDYGENSCFNTTLLNVTIHDNYIQSTLIEATLTTGLEYCKSKNISEIDFLKIDVEGAEHLVLQGFSDLLTSKSIRVIQFEYGYANGDTKFLMRDLHNFFNDYGYIVARVQKGFMTFRDWIYKDNDFNSGPNYVAIPKNDPELRKVLSD